MSNISGLPDEILETIIKQTPTDLTNLKLVCSKFNGAVNTSVHLMKNFEVSWVDIKHEKPQQARKYVNLKVENVIEPEEKLLKFISLHSKTLTTLNLTECSLSKKDLNLFLSFVSGTLISLKMLAVHITRNDDASKTLKVKLENLKDLELNYIGHGCFLFSALETYNLETLHYEDNYHLDSEEIDSFLKFIRQQMSLSKLYINSNEIRELLGNLNTQQHVQFEAKKIGIFSQEDSIEPANLLTFLTTQRKSLKSLGIGPCTLSRNHVRQLLVMFDLNQLGLIDCTFNWGQGFADFLQIDFTNTSIQSLVFSKQQASDVNIEAIGNIIKKCQNVSSIGLQHVEVPYDLSIILAYHSKKLRQILFDNNENITQCHYPTVERISIRECERDELVKLMQVNRHLKLLKVDQIYEKDEVFQRNLLNLPDAVVEYNKIPLAKVPKAFQSTPPKNLLEETKNLQSKISVPVSLLTSLSLIIIAIGIRALIHIW